MMSIQNKVLFCQLVLKKKQILTSIKGRNSVAKLRQTKIYDTNVDLVNDNVINVYTKFGLNLSIRSRDIEQIKGSNSVANLLKTMIYITNVDLVNDYVYTKFGLNRSILFSRY